jgi:uncharacterized membrane protein
MIFFGREWTEHEVEQWIGGLLRSGVLLAAFVALLGGVFFALHYGAAPADFSTFAGVAPGLDSVHGIVSGAASLQSAAVVQLGLLLLIATPVSRVALSLVAFAVQGDRLYVVVTAIVLALLMYGLFGAGA